MYLICKISPLESEKDIYTYNGIGFSFHKLYDPAHFFLSIVNMDRSIRNQVQSKGFSIFFENGKSIDYVSKWNPDDEDVFLAVDLEFDIKEPMIKSLVRQYKLNLII